MLGDCWFILRINLGRRGFGWGFWFGWAGVFPTCEFTIRIPTATVEILSPTGLLNNHFPLFAIRAAHPDLFNIGTGVFAFGEPGTRIEPAVTAKFNHQRVAGIGALLIG